jgi:hypothetical protein
MYNLRIIYQMNNSISSILIIFSFYLLCISWLWLTLKNNSLAGFEIISSHLGKLENLDLSYNIFNDSIFSHMRGLSSLKSLNLSGNMLLGSTTGNGKVVKSLDFSGNLLFISKNHLTTKVSVLYHRFKNSIKITLNFTTYLIACFQFYTS